MIPTYEELLEENRALKAQVAELLARVAELERRLGRNSRNSSKPPSSDPPWAPPRRRRRAGRKRGGQRGHRGTTRSLLPPDQVDEIIEVKPEKCRRCGRKLPGDDPAPRRHQVADVPEDQTKRMFQWWHRVRDGTLKRSSFREYMRPVRRRVEELLCEGASCGAGRMSRSCEKILRLAPALWTFVKVEGVEPTNNAAERAIRPGVLWRKGSFGTDSARGSRFVERIMTAAATCRQQGRNVLEYVTRACEAALRCEPAPSLLPEPAASALGAAA